MRSAQAASAWGAWREFIESNKGARKLVLRVAARMLNMRLAVGMDTWRANVEHRIRIFRTVKMAIGRMNSAFTMTTNQNGKMIRPSK